ncbi:unnamed protein product [Medioppia subpectinata]|uniref:Cytochrome P450 n=1 Tax=Medioppia subpectinata TaxID=1979941 RepID=A0A7R9PUD5_9ACAR|nr:unnamed protein product [Medioppia subpectinata]CAG2101453.1 unnamed protein product [Medioppia subpectinata]
MFKMPLHDVYLYNRNKYGKIYGTKLGSRPLLYVSDPMLINTMNTRDFHVFSDRSDMKSGDPLNDRSLFNLMGNEWKAMRSVISPTFSSGKMRSMHPIIIDCVHRLDQYLETKAINGDELDVKRAMGNLTMDVIASCAFGTQIDTHNDHKTHEFVKNAQQVFASTWRLWLSTLSLYIIPKVIRERIGFSNIAPSVRNFFQSAIKTIIARRMSESNPHKHKDYLQLMLNAQNKCADHTDNNDINDVNQQLFGETDLKDNTLRNKKQINFEITDIDVLASSLLFLLAGYETTASLLSHLLYSLSVNEKCQQRLYEEINAFDGNYSYESIARMPYLEACIAETLRLYNPLSIILKIANEDYKLGDTDITIPKGGFVAFDIQSLHHSPEYYPNPEVWDPERFLPENRSQLVPYTYMPFGTGPRNCVGMSEAGEPTIRAGLGMPCVENKNCVSEKCMGRGIGPDKLPGYCVDPKTTWRYVYIMKKDNYWTKQGVPIVGWDSFWQMFKMPLGDLNLYNRNKHGKIYGSSVGSRHFLTVSDPVLINTMNTTNFHVFVERMDVKTGDPLNDRSLINLMGDEWKAMRSVISPTFSSAKMRSMHPIIIDCVHRLDQYLETKAINGDELDVKRAMGNLTMDVIASCAFGTQIDTHNDHKTHEFMANARKALESTWRAWASALMLFLLPNRIREWIGFSALSPSVNNYFQSAIKSIIARRMSEPNASKHKDFLQLMLNAQNKCADNTDDKDISDDNQHLFGKTDSTATELHQKQVKLVITDIDVLATSLLFIFAGYETTASLLSHLLYSLSVNEKCQQRLYEEIKAFDGNYSYESIARMPYLEACIAETLRLYNPVFATSLHHSPEYYPNPEVWDPERFMPSNRDRLVPYTYLPFGTGPRNCVGMRFALMEAKTAVAHLITKYRFKSTANTAVPLKFKLCQPLLTAENGVPIPGLDTFVQMFKMPLGDLNLYNRNKHGKFYGSFLGGRKLLYVSDPVLINTMNTTDFHVFSNRLDIKSGDPLTDRSLPNLLGNEWKAMRSVISPTFSSGKMRSMHPIIIDCVHRLDQYLETKAINGDELDVKRAMGNLTMDVIASCAFGTQIDTYNDNKTNEFIVNAREVFASTWRAYVMALMMFLLPDRIREWIGFSTISPSVNHFFRSAIKSIIARRMSESNPTKHRDYLQLMINAQNKCADNTDDNDINDVNQQLFGETDLTDTPLRHEKKTNPDVKDIDMLASSFVFFVAGYETTASLLSFLLYSLSVNEKCQQRLYEEINAFDGNYSYESIARMPYLEACIAETLRLYNPLIATVRVANEDYKLGDTGITIPKGGFVTFDIQSLHHSPEYYPNPDVWDPERFLPENRSQLVPYTYMPFGTGPRNCVGMRFALMEAKTAVAHLICKYRFKRTDNTAVPLKFLKFKPMLTAENITIGLELR